MEDNILKLWMPITKEVDGSFVGILSDTSLDRDEEFMSKELLEDWATSKAVLPALANHENKMEKLIGGWTDLKVISKGEHSALIAKPFFFSKEANPLAQQIKTLVEEATEKGLNVGISIGAIPKDKIEKNIEGKNYTVYTKAELLEATWVPIQSNRNASFGHVAKAFDYEVDKMEQSELINKPKEVEDCVKALMADPDFKPKDGKTKEESAWAVCQSKHGKDCPISIKKEEEIMVEEIKKEEIITPIVEITKVSPVVNVEVEELKKKLEDTHKELEDLKSKTAVLKATIEQPLSKEAEIVERINKLQPTVENMLRLRNGLI